MNKNRESLIRFLNETYQSRQENNLFCKSIQTQEIIQFLGWNTSLPDSFWIKDLRKFFHRSKINWQFKRDFGWSPREELNMPKVELQIQDPVSFLSDLKFHFEDKQLSQHPRGVSTSYIVEKLTGRQLTAIAANPYKHRIKELFSKHAIPFQLNCGVGWVPADSQTKFDFEPNAKAASVMNQILADIENDNQQQEMTTESQQQSSHLFGESPQEVLRFLETRLSEKRENGERLGVTVFEICTWLNLECTPSNQEAYRNLIQDFLFQNQINWKVKAGCGFAPIEAENQDGLLFGRSREEVIQFLETRAQEKENLEPHKIPGVNSSEICEWLDIQKSPSNKRNIRNYILTFLKGWEICQNKGFIKTGGSIEETEEIIEEMEQKLGSNSSLTSSNSLKPSPLDKITGILQVAMKHGEICLAAVKEIAAL
jgi:PAS domain-containing protein